MITTQSPSLCEAQARSGIDSSCGLDRNRAKKRLERESAARHMSASPMPGVEVTYLELDADEWRQFAAAV